MKKVTKTALIISSLFLTFSSALAGGVEMAAPTRWDFYIGASGVAYGYEHRLNTAIFGINNTYTGVSSQIPLFLESNLSEYRNITILGGFDIGVGLWADRAYFGLEGRYDIGRLTAQGMVTRLASDESAGVASAKGSSVFNIRMRNNASAIFKLGYQLLPRTMPYILMGWARTGYNLSIQNFSINSITAPPAPKMVEVGTQIVDAYEKSANGGIVGFGATHVLVDGLTMFAEFSLSGYHIPSQFFFQGLRDTNNTGFGDMFSVNYYNYKLRAGLNWSFMSLM